MSPSTDNEPSVSPWIFSLFSRYNRWYLRRHFHALRRFDDRSVPDVPENPPIFYLNHPGWWDPLVGIELTNQYWSSYTHFTPMDEEQLNNFGFFRYLGAFGLDQSSASAGRRFFRICDHIFEQDEAALWMTPQGDFADVRDRPLDFQPGLGHLAARRSTGTLIPVGLTYSFWTDRHPEVLIGFGNGTTVSDHPDRSASDWTQHLEQELEQVLDDLLEADRNRNEQAFQTLLGGSSGVGGIYGTWLSIRNTLFPSDSTKQSSANQQEDPS